MTDCETADVVLRRLRMNRYMNVRIFAEKIGMKLINYTLLERTCKEKVNIHDEARAIDLIDQIVCTDSVIGCKSMGIEYIRLICGEELMIKAYELKEEI